MSTASAKAFEPNRGEAAKGHEPSMEEILASIRRIISDDQGTSRPPAATPQAPPEPGFGPDRHEDDGDVLDLAEMAREAPPLAMRDEEDDVAFRETFSEPRHEMAAAEIAAPEAEIAAPEAEIAVVEAAAPEQAEIAPEPAEIAPEPVEAAPPARGEATAVEMPAAARPEVAERDPVVRQPAMARLSEVLEERLLSPATDVSVSSAFNTLATTILSNNARTLEDLVREMLKPMLKTWLDDNLPVLVERLVRAEIERVARGGRS